MSWVEEAASKGSGGSGTRKHGKKTNDCHGSELRVFEHGVLVAGPGHMHELEAAWVLFVQMLVKCLLVTGSMPRLIRDEVGMHRVAPAQF